MVTLRATIVAHDIDHIVWRELHMVTVEGVGDDYDLNDDRYFETTAPTYDEARRRLEGHIMGLLRAALAKHTPDKF